MHLLQPLRVSFLLGCLLIGLSGCAFFGQRNEVVQPSAAPALLPTASIEVTPVVTSTTQSEAAVEQMITITSPPPRTLVGSPLTLTGQTRVPPTSRSLNYVLRDAAGALLGQGSFPTTLNEAGGANFAASLTFNLPPEGGTVSLEVFEPGSGSAPPLATSRLDLVVAPPQAIVIDSPPPGTQVGSPLTIAGRTARHPFDGVLRYRVLDLSGRELGTGTFPVTGAPGGPSSFSAALNFTMPADGGRISVELLDQHSADNQLAANARLELNVAAQPQQIIITSPDPNQEVGSPLTATGRTVRMPQGSQLSYLVRDQLGQPLGNGMFGLTSQPEGGASFSAQVFFSLPPGGGPISLELRELDPASEAVRASSVLMLSVASPAATATPIVTPTPTAIPTATPVPRQSITIETPASDTLVGSPVVISGRVALYPQFRELYYVIRTPSRETLGQGSFPLGGQPGATNIPYSASLSFAEPAQAGNIIVEVYDRDGVGQVITSALVQLRVAEREQ